MLVISSIPVSESVLVILVSPVSVSVISGSAVSVPVLVISSSPVSDSVFGYFCPVSDSILVISVFVLVSCFHQSGFRIGYFLQSVSGVG